MSTELTQAVVARLLENNISFIQGYKYPTIFKNYRKASIVILNSDGTKTLMECREQNVSGTTDEKLPFLALSMQAAIGKDGIVDAVLIHAGSGFREEALQWVTENTKVKLEAYHGDI